jgi:pimeloyl-ACP methyl ester carboxylesterase
MIDQELEARKKQDSSVNQTQMTAENRFVDAANGIRFAYRRFGVTSSASPPLVLLQHFRGNMDNWDPLLVDTLARHREVILLDNAGVGLSSGTTPRNVTEMARDAIAFVDALGLKEIDLLGYSLGGMVAQEFALLRPRLVRRLVLAGTGPQGGGQQMHEWIADMFTLANAEKNGLDELVRLFFAPTETSIKRGKEYAGRIFSRKTERDKPNSLDVRDAQYDAIVEWGIPGRFKAQSPRRHSPTHARDERRQRHHDPDHKHAHFSRTSPKCTRQNFPRCGSRIPLSMANGIRQISD